MLPILASIVVIAYILIPFIVFSPLLVDDIKTWRRQPTDADFKFKYEAGVQLVVTTLLILVAIPFWPVLFFIYFIVRLFLPPPR